MSTNIKGIGRKEKYSGMGYICLCLIKMIKYYEKKSNFMDGRHNDEPALRGERTGNAVVGERD